ncbi:MAG: hypothetical protein ACRDHD_04740 [Candidatus Limnocylindria bacterium]
MSVPDPDRLPEDGPTELVEGRDGEMVERLSTGTATLLLVWLVGIGAGSALLAAWLFAAMVLNQRMGREELLSGTGLYVALFGAAGPTILWLAGRAQDHRLGWFSWTATKIGAAMMGSLIAVGLLGTLMLGGRIGPDWAVGVAILLGGTLILTQVWALATWAADGYIARARLRDDS